MIRPTLAIAVTFVTLTTAACAGRLLDVGQLDSIADGGSVAASIEVSGGCTAASCANQSLSCSNGAAAIDLTCVPHADAGAASVFTGTCVLEGECPEDAGTLSCATSPLPMVSCTSNVCVASAVAGGYGLVTVETDAPASGAPTHTLSAFFTDADYAFDDMTFGACIYDTHGLGATSESGPVGPAPNPGVISVTDGAASSTLNPTCDGTYPDTQAPGALADDSFLSFAWTTPSGNPYEFPAAYSQLSTPHTITLSSASALNAAAPTLSRAADSAIAWTASGTPLALEQVVVQLVQGESSVTCTFPATDGAGTIPSDALLQLAPGATSYSVYAQHRYPAEDPAETPPGEWTVIFRARAGALTSSGVAKGDLTLQ